MMDVLSYLVVQLTQPTLMMSILYMALGCSLSYVVAELFLKNRPAAKSLIYLIPLFTPALALLHYPPSLTFPAPFFIQVKALAIGVLTDHTIGTTASIGKLGAVPSGEILSIFGVLSLIGLASSIVYLAIMMTVGDRLTSYLCGIIPLTHDENPELFTIVNRLCHIMGVPKPKVAIVEDLKPNAFTFGYGQHTTLVCSLGLLNLLNKKEMKAVLAHEIAHVRNKDFNFKAVTSTLKIMSFFNPLVYLISSAVYRQREILADKTGVSFTRDAYTLGKTLVKVGEAARRFPSNSFRWRIASSFFMISPTRRISNAFSSHPPTVNRLGSLLRSERASHVESHRILLLLMATALLLVSGVTTYFTLVGPALAWAVNLPNGSVVFALGLGPSSLQIPVTSFVWTTTLLHQPAAPALLSYRPVGHFIQADSTSESGYYVPLTLADILATAALMIGSLRSS